MGNVSEFIRSLDSFGEPVGLNYKGESSFKTFYGAFLTLIVRVVIVIVTLQSLLELVDHANPQVTQVS